MRPDVLTRDERRHVVRQLVALCHLVNELVDLAEAESSESVLAQAHTTRRLLQDLVLDTIAGNARTA